MESHWRSHSGEHQSNQNDATEDGVKPLHRSFTTNVACSTLPTHVRWPREQRNGLERRDLPPSVLPEAQARILRWLGPFPDGLREAWDVPRELSLPGMAEGLGLVRSALHVPLNHLVENGLVVVRSAHVIGGGRRRRSVHHLTEEGRHALNSLEPLKQEPPPQGQWIGHRAPTGPAFGRASDVAAIQRLLEEHKAAALTGLAGVGKSTVARCVAEAWCANGGDVRWANVDAYAGLSDLATVLHGSTTFADDVSAAGWLEGCSSNDLLVLDGCEHMHALHAPHIWRAAAASDTGPSWLIVGRAPLESPAAVPRNVLNPLDEEAAKHILGDIENAEAVLSRLGGHPLALHLHRPGMALPGQGEGIEAFVNNAVLSSLSNDEQKAVEELALMPFAVPGDDLAQAESVADLDDRALLLWWTTGGLQVHTLVRHVVLDTMGEAAIQCAAQEGVEHWSNSTSGLAPLMLLHHRMLSGEDGMADAAGAVMAATTDGLGRLSALLSDALERVKEHEREALLGVAAEVAVRRGNVERARSHLDQMDAPDATALAGVLRLEGRGEEAEALLKDAMQASESLRPRMAMITARIEDRLPGQNEDISDVMDMVQALDPATLPHEVRRTAVVAKALLRYSLLVIDGRFDEATDLLADVGSTGALSSEELTDLRWRHAVANDALDSTLLGGLEHHLGERRDLRANALRMSLLERMVLEGHDMAAETAFKMHLPDAVDIGARRLQARLATCLGRLSTDVSRRAKLLHAAAMHRHAGSTRAAKALVDEAHAIRRG